LKIKEWAAQKRGKRKERSNTELPETFRGLDIIPPFNREEQARTLIRNGMLP
jgi:hypothetical protein